MPISNFLLTLFFEHVKNFYPQLFLECKYIIKEKKICKYIIKEIQISSDDCSKEDSEEKNSDVENSNEENSDEENHINEDTEI